MQHAKLSPSSAYRWMRCPGSIRLIDSMPDVGEGEPSPYAIEGIEAHRVLQEALTGQNPPEISPGVELAIEYVKTLQDIFPDAVLETEQQVRLDHIRPNLFGTADIILRSRKARQLVVADYKNGYTPVLLKTDLGPNPQLMYYAAGALGESDDYDTVRLVIIQPNCPQVAAVRELVVPAAIVKEWAEVTLWEAAIATEFPDAPLVPGDHCRWCPARALCPALAQQALEAARAQFALDTEDAEVQPPAPEMLTSEQLARVIRLAPQIESWLKAVKDFARQQLEAGEDIPGIKLTKRKGRREWVSGAQEILVGECGDDSPEWFTLKSPAELEKIIGKEAVEAATTRKPDTLSVEPE